ncbi:MAG: hypothetical protein Q7K45_04320 [Nanoarchaeota archaeon]|nr:hypothetical protein [Nanoarchaeota archaeon]
MVDADTIYAGLGAAALLGGLGFWTTSVARQNRRKCVEEPAQELRRLEAIIDGTTSIGTLERVYQNGNGYLDQQKQKIQISSVGSEVLRIDPVESLHTPNYLADKLETIGEIGKGNGAHYFSLTDPTYTYGISLYSISFHKKVEGK